MFNRFKQWRSRRILANSRISPEQWQRMANKLPVLSRLATDERQRLFDLATLFLHQKTIEGAGGLNITEPMRQAIALQACLPILNLGLDWYAGWQSVIVYPSGFTRNNTSVDEFGVTHTGNVNLSGEAWLKGPVVLSWTDTVDAGQLDGQNVVIHEFVHKLDMLNGRANGFPPMQKGMNPAAWAELMSAAFEDFQRSPKTGLDRYGATEPAEFFAVLSEVFFETPELLQDAYPDVYQLMTRFFQQIPLE